MNSKKSNISQVKTNFVTQEALDEILEKINGDAECIASELLDLNSETKKRLIDLLKRQLPENEYVASEPAIIENKTLKVDEDKEVLNIKDVQAILGISRSKVYELVSSPDFPSVRVGRLYKIPRTSFNEWLKNTTN